MFKRFRPPFDPRWFPFALLLALCLGLVLGAVVRGMSRETAPAQPAQAEIHAAGVTLAVLDGGNLFTWRTGTQAVHVTASPDTWHARIWVEQKGVDVGTLAEIDIEGRWLRVPEPPPPGWSIGGR
jgi:hypothetical protein